MNNHGVRRHVFRRTADAGVVLGDCSGLRNRSNQYQGFSLGVGAVLFSGHGIGISYGKEFFAGLTSRTGLRYKMLALVAIIITTAVTIGLMKITSTPATYMAGLLSGATTTAAAVMAAVDTAKNSDPAIGYSVAFPIGLLGTILGMYFMQLFVKPKMETFERKQLKTIEVLVAG